MYLRQKYRRGILIERLSLHTAVTIIITPLVIFGLIASFRSNSFHIEFCRIFEVADF